MSWLNNSQVSTFANNSTINAYELLVTIKTSNPEEFKKKKKILDENWEKISVYELRKLILDAFLTFSPTFIFSVLVYSLIKSPESWLLITVFFVIFLILMIITSKCRILCQSELYKLGQAQESLKQKIKENNK
ncbi:MAG: hypothetical protein ABH821_00335 [archaeon]